MEDKKKSGRPSEGMDYGRETIRLSQQQYKTIRKYSQGHGGIKISAAVRGLIDQMGLIMNLSDTIEQAIGMLYDAAQVQQSLVGVLGRIDAESAAAMDKSADEIRRVAFLLSSLCYEENLPNVTQKHFEFQRAGGKLLIEEKERKKDKRYWLMHE